MWWIALVVAVVLLLIILIAVCISKSNRGNYGDSGGTQVGGNERIPFFAPANDKAGMWGEKLVNYHLKSLLSEDEYILANLLLPLGNGCKTEIDCVLISHKGIFCIETKNWVGHISGNDEDEYWHQAYDDPYMSDRDHRNPIKQNEGHCAALKKLFYDNYEVYNIVIFAELEDGCEIESQYALTIDDFKEQYNEWDNNELNTSQIKNVYDRLVHFVASKEELERHKEEVRNRFN